MTSPPPRTPSLTWRLVPWLFPVALILVGLGFVAVGLSGSDEPGDIVAPPNVRDVTVANAGPWASRQVLPGFTSSVIGVVLASSTTDTPTTYTVRAVIARIDAPVTTAATAVDTVPDELLRTVVTCVRWTVDVSSGTIVERGADQLSNEFGRHEPPSASELRADCLESTFAG